MGRDERSEDPGEQFRRAVAGAVKGIAISVMPETVRTVRQNKSEALDPGEQFRRAVAGAAFVIATSVMPVAVRAVRQNNAP